LLAETAGDLMTPNLISIGAQATVHEALAALIDKGFSGAPVINNAGRPIGVLSRSDVLRSDRERATYAQQVPEFYEKSELLMPSGERYDEGFQVEAIDRTEVRELMSPVVFSVTRDTSALETIQAMLARRVHRLFVTDASGTLVGVISAFDILSRIGPE
jgi:CBS domain-containing protein